jgi:large subunit ribosomal protein L16
MFEPKRRKYRKSFRGKMRGTAIRGASLSFGDFGLKAMDRGWLSSKQLEAGRRAITGALKRGGKMWVRVFPDMPVTSRAAGQRMGSGKGEIDRYVAVITPGKLIYEIAGVTDVAALDALRKAGTKMPFITKIISKTK